MSLFKYKKTIIYSIIINIFMIIINIYLLINDRSGWIVATTVLSSSLNRIIIEKEKALTKEQKTTILIITAISIFSMFIYIPVILKFI